jgi:hypothetical protein
MEYYSHTGFIFENGSKNLASSTGFEPVRGDPNRFLVPGKTREIPGTKTAGNYLPFISGDATSGDVISGDVISADATSGRACVHDHFRHHHTAPPQMLTELCPYTTLIPVTFECNVSFTWSNNDFDYRY